MIALKMSPERALGRKQMSLSVALSFCVCLSFPSIPLFLFMSTNLSSRVLKLEVPSSHRQMINIHHAFLQDL